jgi:GT2 family glycosyltransferase
VKVSVTIVAWNSAPDLRRCLDSVAAQTRPVDEVVVVDNGSTDGSGAIARSHAVVSLLEENRDNRGFAGGQNQAIRHSRGDWILTLNPDVVLRPDFVATLIARAEGRAESCDVATPRIGTLCGKLLRLGAGGTRLEPPVLDSTGIVFTRAFRHLDRGAGEPDRGQWDEEGPVFGASAAAALYRREMIEDVSLAGEFFDELFFAYREDADVAWRAQLLGWDTRYVPAAIAEHVRRVVPERRGSLPPELNRYSVRNRFLMRWKNADAAVWRRCGLRGLARDLLVVAGCALWEWRSLPGLVEAVRFAPRSLRARRLIQSRRRRPGSEIARWFD